MAVYLDYAAAEPVKNSVLSELRENTEMFYNPSSVSNLSRANFRSIQATQKKIAEMINCKPEEIYFTSGASESNSWAIDGLLKADDSIRVISTETEHSSVLENPNVNPVLEVDRNGFVRLDSVKRQTTDNTLVVITHANNEIGCIQDVKIIRSIMPDGSLLMVDAAQTFAKIPIDVQDMKIDLLSASAGKVGGLRGVGFLYIREGLDLKPIIYGTQQNGLRGGTYFDLGIRSLLYALDEPYPAETVSMKRNFLLDQLKEIPEVHLIGTVQNRLPNNVLIAVRHVTLDSQQMISLLEEQGFIVSAGSACHAGAAKISHVLDAIGMTEDEAKTVLRITIGPETDVNDLVKFAQALKLTISMFREPTWAEEAYKVGEPDLYPRIRGKNGQADHQG